MKMKIILLILLMGMVAITGCSKTDNLDVDNSKLEEANSKYDIENILNDQKIVFIMSDTSFEERFTSGYFIDGNGKQHIYKLYDRGPFELIEQTYEYLVEHYDEFEAVEFFDSNSLIKCTEALYCVNPESEIIQEGKVIIDCPVEQLYGVKMINGKEEFVFLKSYTGISKQLADPYAEIIYKEFGDDWNKNK